MEIHPPKWQIPKPNPSNRWHAMRDLIDAPDEVEYVARLAGVGLVFSRRLTQAPPSGRDGELPELTRSVTQPITLREPDNRHVRRATLIIRGKLSWMR